MLSMFLCSCLQISGLQGYYESKGKNDEFFFSRTLLTAGDRQEQEDESLPSTAAKGNRAKPPRQRRAHQSDRKGKGCCQKCSAMQDMEFSCNKYPPSQTSSGGTWTMLSSPCTSYLATDSPFKHTGSLGSFFNPHLFFLAGIF